MKEEILADPEAVAPPGSTAPLAALQEKFGFEPGQVAAVARQLLEGR